MSSMSFWFSLFLLTSAVILSSTNPVYRNNEELKAKLALLLRRAVPMVKETACQEGYFWDSRIATCRKLLDLRSLPNYYYALGYMAGYNAFSNYQKATDQYKKNQKP